MICNVELLNKFKNSIFLKMLSIYADWGPQIDVVGFCFLDLAANYEPPESLVRWLDAGNKPIYVGFGSLVSSISHVKRRKFSCVPIKEQSIRITKIPTYSIFNSSSAVLL
jgi:UDP:flavonoid glycosyltransferase YjiC (YdhE family)